MATTLKSGITTREDLLADLDRLLHHGNAPLAIGLVDVDDFAEVNSDFGYAKGDEVLVALERVFASNLPKDALLRRIGGDEYAVGLPGVSAENALVLLDEIRRHFIGHLLEGLDRPVSLSIGVAANPPHANAAEGLWRSAGEALMRAKRDGANRVAIYVEEKMVLKSNYYSRANLERLAKLSSSTSRTEASLLREALDDLVAKYDL